jgi:hypothetical protein
MSIEALGSTPRAGQYGDKPGSYRLAVRTVTPEVDPGERMIMKVMICGYGEIAGTKLAVYPSPDSYVPEESSILHGLRRDGTVLKYGRETQQFDPVGAVLVLRGLQAADAQGNACHHPTSFFDRHPNSSDTEVDVLATETELDKAPVEIVLKIRSNIRTGLHGLQFVLTYYDGERWQTDKQIVSVQVNNFIQQRPVLLGWRQPNPLPEIR